MQAPIFYRRVVGASMAPKLRPGELIVVSRLYRRLRPGHVVVFEHDGKEKVKRIERVADNKLFVIGDNLPASTDSRQFGWLELHQVVGRVFWPKKLAK